MLTILSRGAACLVRGILPLLVLAGAVAWIITDTTLAAGQVSAVEHIDTGVLARVESPVGKSAMLLMSERNLDPGNWVAGFGHLIHARDIDVLRCPANSTFVVPVPAWSAHGTNLIRKEVDRFQRHSRVSAVAGCCLLMTAALIIRAIGALLGLLLGAAFGVAGLVIAQHFMGFLPTNPCSIVVISTTSALGAWLGGAKGPIALVAQRVGVIVAALPLWPLTDGLSRWNPALPFLLLLAALVAPMGFGIPLLSAILIGISFNLSPLQGAVVLLACLPVASFFSYGRPTRWLHRKSPMPVAVP